jgi:hypothetical protein
VARFKHMVDMTRTDEEKTMERFGDMAPSIDVPDVPYGLCICLTERELDKLDLDDDCEVGDFIHVFAMAKVTSVSKSDTGNGPKCRIELAIVSMELEDEALEREPDDEGGE